MFFYLRIILHSTLNFSTNNCVHLWTFQQNQPCFGVWDYSHSFSTTCWYLQNWKSAMEGYFRLPLNN